LITERTVCTAPVDDVERPDVGEPSFEVEEHGAGLPVHAASLDGDAELAQAAADPGEKARDALDVSSNAVLAPKRPVRTPSESPG
jgi:hypothetical protein